VDYYPLWVYVLSICLILVVVIIFITVVCVACTSKRHQNDVWQNTNEFVEEESLEKPKLTLEPADYDIWMPKISYKKMQDLSAKFFQ
jgi:hypothetical protein